MKVLVLSLLAAVALAVQFNTPSGCTQYNAGCGGSASDPATCLGQDALVVGYLAAEGIDATSLTTWTAAQAQALARLGHQMNWNSNSQFSVHIDLEPIYRCTVEASGLVWSQATACFDEWGSCVTDATCLATWNTIAATTAVAGGMTFTTVNGVEAIGSVPFTPLNDHTTTPPTAMTPQMLGALVAVSDMSGNGKVMAMNACMLKNWVVNADYPTGVDIQNAYVPCFDVAVACSNSAACAAASTDVKNCAADSDITMVPHAMLTNLWTTPAGASHDDWCAISACASENGNSLFMSVGTCMMDSLNLQFTKCYDDMMAHLMMWFCIIGGIAFVVGVLMFTTAWCLCCRSNSKGAAHGVEP